MKSIVRVRVKIIENRKKTTLLESRKTQLLKNITTLDYTVIQSEKSCRGFEQNS